MPAPTPSPVSSPSRATTVAIVGTDLVLAAFPATPVQIAHALEHLGFEVVVPASWGDELLAAAALAQLDERGGVPAVFCACPRVADRLLATGQELAPMLLSLVVPAVAAARYVRAAFEGTRVTVTYLGGCGGAIDPSIDARMTPREFLRALQDQGIVLSEMPRVFEGIIPPDRRRHFSLPGGLPAAAQLAGLAMPRRLACLTSADYAAELAQLVIAREPVLIDVAARLGCACAGATSITPFDHAHETVMHLEPPRAAHPVVDVSLAGTLDAPLPPPRAPEPPRAPIAEPTTGPRSSSRTSTPPRPLPAFGGPVPPRSVQHTPPSHTQRFTTGEPTTGPLRRRGGVSGFFRAVGSAEQPLARTGEGLALPRAYVAKRRPASDGARTSGEQRAAELRERMREREQLEAQADERERPISRHVEPVATPVPAEAPRRATAAVARAIATPDDLPPVPATMPAGAPVALPATVASSAPRTALVASAQDAAARLIAAFTRSEAAPIAAASDAREPRESRDALAVTLAMATTRETAVPDVQAAPAAVMAPSEGDPASNQASALTSSPAGTPHETPHETLHVTPRIVPPPPSAGSGRELVFFVVGAVLAGLAFALFR